VSTARRAALAIWAVAAKDLRIALTERMSMIQAITLPVNYLLMMSLFVLAGSNAPTAVVMLSHGPYARQFVAAMEHARTFRVTIEPPAGAGAQMRAGTLVAEVIIPADFDQAISHQRPAVVRVIVNNLNEDLTDDAHRGVRLALASFYATSAPGQVPVTVADADQYPQDTGYIPYLALSIIVIAVMVAGLLQAGNAAAREFEDSTISGLLVSGARAWQVLAGRMLGAFTASLPAVAVVLAVVVAIVGDHPARALMTVAITLLTLAVFTAAGTALGTLTRDRALVAIITRAVPVPLFFLSGVFAPLSYQTAAVQAIGGWLPVHFAVVLVQWSVRGLLTGTMSLPADAAILAAYLAAFALASAAALRLATRSRARSRPPRPPARHARVPAAR
jgi:ABC-2 type transport system permease protein